MNRRIKVLLVGPGPETRGGITSVIAAIVGSDLAKAYELHWVITHSSGNRAIKLLIFFRGLWNFLKQISTADLVHLHYSEPISASRKLIFLLIAKIFCKPIVSHFHSFSPETTFRGRWAYLYYFLFKNSSAVILLSEYWLQSAKNFRPELEQRFKVVKNPCSLPIVRYDVNERRKDVLFAGTLSSRKGFSDLIMAFAQIPMQIRSGWRLVLLGDGDLDRVEYLTRKQRLTHCLVAPGWVVGNEKNDYFRCASIFCLPSYAEGLPMAALDAICFGLPLVYTPVGGMADWAERDVVGRVVAPGDISALSAELSRLMQSKQLRVEESERSNRLAVGEYSLQIFAQNLDAVYRESIG